MRKAGPVSIPAIRNSAWRNCCATIKCEREDVEDWFAAESNAARETLLSETLRPAPTTDAWRALADDGRRRDRGGIERHRTLGQAADPAQEALAIALALREALETPGRRAALVTPDRNLARRVAAEMTRWGIAIDDSAGRPLAHTARRQLSCACLRKPPKRGFAPVPLLALLKHPFASGAGRIMPAFRARARELDRWCLRGPRPDAGLVGHRQGDRIARAPIRATATWQSRWRGCASWWREIAAILAPLESMLRTKPMWRSATLCQAHLAAAEAAWPVTRAQDCLLWARRRTANWRPNSAPR